MFVSCCDCIIAGQYAISEEELWRLDENVLAALFLRLMVCPVPQYVTPMSLLISLLMGLLSKKFRSKDASVYISRPKPRA